MGIRKLKPSTARKEAAITQIEMAKMMGVSESTIINWEKYRSEPTISQAKQYAELCGFAVDEINFLPKSTE